MNTYIQKDKEGFYFETTEELMNAGITYPDFLNGRPIKLSEDQVLYHNEHLDADIQTVLNVREYKDGEVAWYVFDTPMTLDYAKELKVKALDEYDRSNAVNDVTINNTIHGWVDAETRATYRNSIDAAKLIGETTISFFVEDLMFTVTIQQAEYMLAMVQSYADKCFIVTSQHRINIQKLETIEEVENYDFTVGYPEKLNFTV